MHNQTQTSLDFDVYAFEGSQRQNFKRQIYNRTHHFLNNYDASDQKTQLAAEQYIYADAKFLTQEEFDNIRRKTFADERIN